MSETRTSTDLKDLRPYRVQLSVIYDVLVLGSSELQMWDNSFPWINEVLRSEEPIAESPQITEVAETDLSTLPANWDEYSLLYGSREEVSVADARKLLAEREAAELKIGDRVYDRRMDLFGQIERIIIGPNYKTRADCPAKVKYEYPMSPDAEPREVRLSELIAANKVER